MKARTAVALLLCGAAAVSACRRERPGRSVIDDQVRAQLRARLETVESPPELCAAGRRIQASEGVREFYRRRDYRPAWSAAGVRRPAAEALLRAIDDAGAEGLHPEDYHRALLKRLLNRPQTAAPAGPDGAHPLAPFWTNADLLMTDAFLLLAAHLADGKVDQDARAAVWSGRGREEDLPGLLETALREGTIAERLGTLRPRHAYYAALKDAYADYRRTAGRGGWPAIGPGPALGMGLRDPRTEILRRRLLVEYPALRGLGSSGDLFDYELAAAVCAFQQRHGLRQSGAVDETTRAALNVPAAERARQIAWNLERWRWLPADLGPRYVLVDVTAFEMFVVEAGDEILRMKIVAGTSLWPTPVFTSVMTDIVLNPSWTAPSRVLVKELINYMRADPNYLKTNGMYLFRGWGEEAVLLDPASITLGQVTEKTLDFYLVQMPGPLNVLGRLKFSHPNRYDVFLHDTPYQSDFGQEVRTFSHGCIRIARPEEFALYLINDGRRWTREDLEALLGTGEERMIVLDRRIDVHVFSGTAWALEDGTVHFRPDLYGADPMIARELDAPPPQAADAVRPEAPEKP